MSRRFTENPLKDVCCFQMLSLQAQDQVEKVISVVSTALICPIACCYGGKFARVGILVPPLPSKIAPQEQLME